MWKRSRVLRVAVRGLLLVLSLGAAAGLGELVVRRADPYGISYYRDAKRYFQAAIEIRPAAEIRPESRLFQNRPRVDLELATFRFATDSLGFRSYGPEHMTEPRTHDAPRERLRVLFLGDSVTLAWGVDHEETWIRRLEVGARARDGRALECLNAGHLQYNTTQEADLLASCAGALLPDAVVVAFVANDVADDAFATYTALTAPVPAAEQSTGERWSAQLRWCALTWFPGLWGLCRLPSEIEAGRPPEIPVVVEEHPSYAAGWERCRSAFERLRAQCEAIGARLVVLDHGTPRVAAVREWCAANGVAWYDFAFDEREHALGLQNSVADAHANALGNELLCAKAWRALADAGLLAEPLASATASSLSARSSEGPR